MRSKPTLFALLWRRGVAAGLLALLGLVLAACAGGTDPFGKDGPTAVPPKGKTPPAIVIRSMAGIPPQLARDLKTTLAVSAGQHDIGIVEGSLPGGVYSLEGVFKATADAGGSRITFMWTLRDTNGVMVDQSMADEMAPAGAGGDPWSGVSPEVLQRIADKTAQTLALKLSALGFATRVSSLVTPPTETFAMAGPGAAKEIDYETLDGPGAVDPTLTQDAAVLQDVAVPSPAPAPVKMAATGDGSQGAAQADAKPATVIKAVAVIPVKGAPGPGNDELTRAMRRTLAAAGWPVVSTPRPDALTIAGVVEMSKPAGPTQTVKLSWVIRHPSGSTLGDVKQSNDVAVGALDQGFGEAAVGVTEAAATGIFDLIRKYR